MATATRMVACVAGARNKWARGEGSRVSLARARSFMRPFIPSACYAGYENGKKAKGLD